AVRHLVAGDGRVSTGKGPRTFDEGSVNSVTAHRFNETRFHQGRPRIVEVDPVIETPGNGKAGYANISGRGAGIVNAIQKSSTAITDAIIGHCAFNMAI